MDGSANSIEETLWIPGEWVLLHVPTQSYRKRWRKGGGGILGCLGLSINGYKYILRKMPMRLT